MTHLESANTENTISLNTALRALSEAPRRRILGSLLRSYPRSGEEFEQDGFDLDEQAEEATRVALYHKHIPHLVDVGLIEWDADSATITRGPRFESIRPLLGLLEDNPEKLPEPWH